MTWRQWWRDLLEVVEPEVLEPDCLLCTGKAVPHGGTLLGMDVCRPCAGRYALGWSPLPPRDAVRWATEVLHIRMEYNLERYPLRVSTRMLLAKLAGLEVDVANLTDYMLPALEFELFHG